MLPVFQSGCTSYIHGQWVPIVRSPCSFIRGNGIPLWLSWQFLSWGIVLSSFSYTYGHLDTLLSEVLVPVVCFFIGFPIFFLWNCEGSLFFTCDLCQIDVLEISSPNLWLAFHSQYFWLCHFVMVIFFLHCLGRLALLFFASYLLTHSDRVRHGHQSFFFHI